MFLRSLYGSRMPQPLHPRSNDQVSNYWSDDTESSRELARLMSEIDMSDDSDDVKKPPLPAVVADSTGAATRRGSLFDSALLSRIAPVAQLDTLDSINVDDVEVPAQLSPTGLISIAAADIDEATRSNGSVAVNTELDLEMLNTIRRASSQNSAPRQILVENFMARMLAGAAPTPLSSSPPSNTQQSEEESPLRFLSLLRRINELRSQQVQQDADVWDGLPYPQILALPTFKYTVRERANEPEEGSGEEPINNTMCAVCYTEYAPDEEVRALPCLHFYHRECIDQWLLHHRKCPICTHVVAVY